MKNHSPNDDCCEESISCMAFVSAQLIIYSVVFIILSRVAHISWAAPSAFLGIACLYIIPKIGSNVRLLEKTYAPEGSSDESASPQSERKFISIKKSITLATAVSLCDIIVTGLILALVLRAKNDAPDIRDVSTSWRFVFYVIMCFIPSFAACAILIDLSKIWFDYRDRGRDE